MNSTGSRTWGITGTIAALAIVVLTWLLVISPARSNTATLRDDTATVQQQNQVLLAKNNQLRKVADNQGQLETDVRSALAALPSDAELPDLNQQLAQHAAAWGVALTSISVGAAVTPAPVSDVAAPAGMLSIPITIQTKGPALSQYYFLRDLQRTGPRAALVTSTSLSADESDVNNGSTMTTQFTAFTASLTTRDQELLTTALGDDLTTG